MKRNRIFGFSAVAACLVLLGGCDDDEAKYQLRFSHYLHVEDNGMDCSDCHGELGNASFTPITHATCLECHEEPEAEEISAVTCGICHQPKQVERFSLPESGEGNEAIDEEYQVREPEDRRIFVHTEALAGRCTECHAPLMDEAMEMVPGLQRSDILAIRETAHASGQACMTCHIGMDPGLAPESHDRAWTKRHGMLALQDDASCSVCHTQDSCTDCHSVMQPASHNNVFRRQTHGVVAAWDRATCQVCHEEDACTSCHATTRPRSHNARWAAPGYKPTHCIGCHDTSTPGDGCVTCHEGGNDVMLHEQYWGGASFDHSKLTSESCYICHWTQTP